MDNLDKRVQRVRHQQQLSKLSSVENTLVSSVKSLQLYLDSKVTKTEVINQLKEIGTPDALKVERAVNELHATLKTHKNTDLSEVSKLLKQLIEVASKPQAEIKIPEAPDTVKVSNLKDIDFATLEKAIVKAISTQKAPVVNVPQTEVKVEAPDLSALKEVVTAIKAIPKVDIPKTDLIKLESEAKDTNKKLDTANKHLETISKIRGGGGGGGTGTSFKNAAGNLVYVELDVDGKVPTSGTASLAGDTIPIAGATTAVSVGIVDGSGNQITSFGGGTQYADGAARGTATGTIAMGDDGTNIQSIKTDSSGVLAIQDNGGSITVDGTVTATPTGTQNVDVTANTIGLATGTKQDTGNTSVASIDTKTPALGQALAAASTPVVLTAAQISTLTPPAAITGYATSTIQTDKSQFTKLTDGTDTALITAAGEQNVIATAQPGVDIGDVTVNNAAGASAVNIQDGGNSITVDGAVTTSGTVTEANSASILTSVQLIDDTVATLGTTTYTEAATKGNVIGAVRRDANTTLVDTTNEVAPLQVNATGELKVAQIQALPAGTNNIGDVDVLTVPTDPFGANADAASATGSISAKLKGIATALGVTALDLGTGTGGTRTLRIFQDTAQFVGGTGVDTSAVQRVSLATNVALPAGTNLMGKVGIDQTTPGTTNLVALTAETTKVIGVTRTADGSGNLLTSTSNALDVNVKTSTTTSTQTSVANSVASVQLLAANTSRESATIYNDDTAANLYVKFGTTASTTSFKIKIAPGGYYEFPLPIYTGRVDGIASAATGSARICEET